MLEFKLKRTGPITNAGKIEALMKHMQYPPEKIQEVLASLNTKTKEENNDDMLEEKILAKKGCEAELLSKLLEEKEVQAWTKKHASSSKPSSTDGPKKPTEPREAWPKHQPGQETESAEPDVPIGCRLRHYAPASASPYWRGELPQGETHLGRMSRSRSYVHSEGIGKANVESDAARAAVVAWLWEWNGKTADGKSSGSAEGSKKRQRS